MLPENYRGYMNGLDFSQPVSIETFDVGKKLWQFQVPGGVQGMWYSPTPNVLPTQLGIETTERVSVLRSISAPALDDWFVKVQPFQTLGRARQMTSTEKSLFKLVSPGD